MNRKHIVNFGLLPIGTKYSLVFHGAESIKKNESEKPADYLVYTSDKNNAVEAKFEDLKVGDKFLLNPWSPKSIYIKTATTYFDLDKPIPFRKDYYFCGRETIVYIIPKEELAMKNILKLSDLKPGDKFTRSYETNYIYKVVDTSILTSHDGLRADKIYYVLEKNNTLYCAFKDTEVILVEVANKKVVQFSSLDIGAEYTTIDAPYKTKVKVKISVGYGYFEKDSPFNVLVVLSDKMTEMVLVEK